MAQKHVDPVDPDPQHCLSETLLKSLFMFSDSRRGRLQNNDIAKKFVFNESGSTLLLIG
jgi:hypothetical protein